MAVAVGYIKYKNFPYCAMLPGATERRLSIDSSLTEGRPIGGINHAVYDCKQISVKIGQ